MVSSELIVNKDGSIYHLHMFPEDLADHVILVGDPGRVSLVTSFFDTIEMRRSNREFVSNTGYYKGMRFTVLSTGIGTDNIDIVLNELDALANIDLGSGQPVPEKRKLMIVRIGTSGSLQKDIPLNTFLFSHIAIGFDGVLHFYSDTEGVRLPELEQAFIDEIPWPDMFNRPYAVKVSADLKQILTSAQTVSGITLSAPGFYGPQGRVLRLHLADGNLNSRLARFEWEGVRITNYEMESSALYGLSRMLGHEAATICGILANRATGEVNNDYIPVIKKLINYVLDKLAGT
ncbi:MAG: nucleoside phosphorylase [Chlorobi bacterium]|nr:nucleoside phosphorylase [Chlorobiota bacterium]